MRRIFPLFLAALLGCGTPSPLPRPAAASATAAPPAASPAAPLGVWVDTYVAAFGKRWGEGYAFSGYLALVRDGEVVFGKAYGKVDRGKGVVATTDTRFRIGSLTKQFTAAAILTLVERGKLRTSDSIRAHLPDAPASWDEITIHHLLTHTSGIASYTADAELMNERERPHTRAQVIAHFRERPPEFEPGARFAYSNSGYFLLGVVIERVSGMTYEAYLKEHVLAPAGMTRTSTVDAPDAPDAAIGYTIGDDDEVERARTPDMSVPFSAGALRSTVTDLVAWDRALAGTAVLGEASRQRMFTVDKSTYAYGVNRAEQWGHDVLSHTGGIDGFTSYFARALDTRWSVIALSNNDGFEAKKVGIAALEMALTGEPLAPPEERAALAVDAAFAGRVTGEYRLTEESKRLLAEKVPKAIIDSAVGMTLSFQDGRLFMKPSGQPRVRVFRGADGVLFTKRDPLELLLSPADAAGPVAAITLRQSGIEGRYERAPSAEKPGG